MSLATKTLEEISTYHSSFFITCLILTLALPFISFLVSFAISEKYSWLVSFSAPFLLLINTLAAFVVFYWTWNNDPFTAEWTWITFGEHSFTAGILINNTSALMLVVVTLVSFLVNFYSIGYMAGDPDIRRYFAMLGFFSFSMLGIVASSNLLMIFIFWELVGFSSYMLIGHWNQKQEAADAAKRAFILNRVGDAGFVVGLMIVWSHTGSFDIQYLNSVISSDAGWQTAASLGIFCGIIGKSAQFPLFAWLPDAMEGPTPVSALIHAATMVAAGVFLLARVHFLFTPVTLDVVAITGCITALLGALSALAQYDLKKILAYSTVSQLGLMITSLGAGAPEAAMLHLFTHAFFKACLFLAAGSVIHSLHQAQHQSHTTFDVQDIRNLGGLKKKLPYTFLMFVLSGASLAGIPFFSGFLSKDAILASVFVWKGDVTWRWLILVCAFLVSFITVLYTFRMIWSIFFGNERATKNLSVVEPPPVMRAPMALLAAASLWIIASANPFNFSGWVYNGLVSGKHFHLSLVAIFSAAWVLLALLTAYLIRNRSFEAAALRNGFYFNDMYRKVIEIPAFKTASITALTDRKWIDGFLHVGAYVQLIVAHFTGWIDRAVVDGVVDDAASMTKGIGSFIRSFQSGKIQLYVFWASFAIIIFIIWTLL